MTLFVVWIVNGDGREVESERPASVWPTLEKAEAARKQMRTCSFVTRQEWGPLLGWEARV